MGRPARRGLSSCASLLVATTGCAQLAGIDETSGLIPPDRVSLAVDRISVGATVARLPQDLSANTASFAVPDDSVPEGFTLVPADLTDTGVWTAEVPDGTPAVKFDLPDFPLPLLRWWQLPSRNLTAMITAFEHPSPTPAPAGATLTVGATLPTQYVSGQSFQFVVVGTWNSRGFTAAELPLPDMANTTIPPATFAFTSMAKITGRPHEKITSADAGLLLRYSGARLSGVMEAAPFEQTDADTIMGTMTAVPADQMLEASLQPNLVAGRYAPLRPAMTGIGMSWSLTAAPGIDVGASLGVSLHAGTVVAADPPLTVPFGNPFVAKGWRSLFLWSTTASRTFTPAGQMLPATLTAGLFTYTEPTPGMMLTLPAALPELITINGMPLSSDGLSIPQPTGQVTVSFVAAGTNTLYFVQLYELVPNAANTALVQQFVIESVGLTKELILPPDAFVAGKRYTLRAVSVEGGYPNAAMGDLATHPFPMSFGAHESGVFTVTP